MTGPALRRRSLAALPAVLLVTACDPRAPAPTPAAPAGPSTPPAPEPMLQTTSDGRPIVIFSGLRYSTRPPLGWRLKPLAPRGQENAPGDVVILAAAASEADPVAADTQISLEAFHKSDRAPTYEAKLANIVTDRRRLRSDFAVENELPIELRGGRKAYLFRMRNVPSGDSEAVAYVDEGAVVAEMVLVAKTRAAFDATLPLFREMVRTYQRLS